MKAGIKLWQLLDAIDYNRDSEIEKIQICRPNGDGWDDFDEVGTSSSLLLPIYKAEIQELSAVGENVVRVSINWDALDLYKWGEKEEDE